MNVSELIEALSQFDGDLEVRLAIQPSWSFEHEISGVVTYDAPDIITRAEYDEMTPEYQDLADQRVDNGEAEFVDDGEPEPPTPCVYIGEGRQVGYLATAAKNALGW